MSHKALVDAVFEDTGLDVFLDSLKQDRGDSASLEVMALVSNSMEMMGVSTSCWRTTLSAKSTADSQSIYRTTERIGRNSDAIVKFWGRR